MAEDATIPFSKSPWLIPGGTPEVCVAHGQGAYDNTASALSGMDLSPVKGRRVLLKPNVGRMAKAGSGVITHPDVVAAAIDAFRDAGADVAIGESPILGVKTPAAMEISGMAAMADDRHCPMIDLDERKPEIVPIPDGTAIHQIKLCADVQDFDFIVSIPVMKMHMHTMVTLAVKNMKGCLYRRSKVDLHMLPPIEGHDDKPLNIAIADMSSILRPHLSIVDGTFGMEGLGPSAGKVKPVDSIVVGADPFAVDAVACRLMGVAPEDVPHLRIGAERGYGTIDLSGIRVSPGHWETWIIPFEPAPENLSIKFPNTEILDNQSCSACQSTLMLFLQRYGDEMFQYYGGTGPIRIAIGKGHADVPEGTICIGNCTAQHKNRGVFVSGCPPVASAILNAIKENSKS